MIVASTCRHDIAKTVAEDHDVAHQPDLQVPPVRGSRDYLVIRQVGFTD